MALHGALSEAGETLARAVRSTPTDRAGNRAPRFIAATFFPVIRDPPIARLGFAAPDGGRNEPPVVAAASQEYERLGISRRAQSAPEDRWRIVREIPVHRALHDVPGGCGPSVRSRGASASAPRARFPARAVRDRARDRDRARCDPSEARRARAVAWPNRSAARRDTGAAECAPSPSRAGRSAPTPSACARFRRRRIRRRTGGQRIRRATDPRA